jgi:hypothetical protein
VAAPGQPAPEFEHQPHAPAATRLSAYVMVDERDVHVGQSAIREDRQSDFSRAAARRAFNIL